MKLLHVVTTLDVGGAEMHLLAQTRGQVQRGHRVRVAYLKGQGSLAADFQAVGAEEVLAVGSGPAALGRLFPHLRWAEIVHTHLLKADVLGAVAATLAGRRGCLISGKHNDEQVLKRPLVSFVHGLVGRLPRVTVVLSDHVGRFVEEHGRVPRRRQERIYYGLDPAPFHGALEAGPEARGAARAELGIGPEEVVFTCVARFAPQKAHDVLLRAFAKARERRSDLRLLLLGDDPFGDGRRRAEALAREIGVHGPVIFAGIRRDVPRLLAASDCFVMASLWEGLGLVFLEAMACELPVLATQVSAVPEVVIDGETGLLVPPADVDSLAEGLLALAADPERRRRLGQAGRARVEQHFGIDRMVDETLAVYRRVARGGPH